MCSLLFYAAEPRNSQSPRRSIQTVVMLSSKTRLAWLLLLVAASLALDIVLVVGVLREPPSELRDGVFLAVVLSQATAIGAWAALASEPFANRVSIAVCLASALSALVSQTHQKMNDVFFMASLFVIVLATVSYLMFLGGSPLKLRLTSVVNPAKSPPPKRACARTILAAGGVRICRCGGPAHCGGQTCGICHGGDDAARRRAVNSRRNPGRSDRRRLPFNPSCGILSFRCLGDLERAAAPAGGRVVDLHDRGCGNVVFQYRGNDSAIAAASDLFVADGRLSCDFPVVRIPGGVALRGGASDATPSELCCRWLDRDPG